MLDSRRQRSRHETELEFDPKLSLATISFLEALERSELNSRSSLFILTNLLFVVLLAINVEQGGAKVVSDFLKEFPYSFPILLDEQNQTQNSYTVFQYPSSFIVDRQGIVVKKLIGAVHWMGGDIYNLLHFMLKG